MKNIQTVARKHAGYTIDQTILIVAVIAILITLIIASVGWDLLQRTSGTKLASQLRQIEDSNGQFLARHNVWASDAAIGASGTVTANEINILALIQDDAVAAQFQAEHQNMLPSVTTTAAGAPQHQFGAGGSLGQSVDVAGAVCGGSDDRLLLELGGVPETELLRANAAIDGDAELTPDQIGRLRWGAVASGVADLTYCANVLN